MDSCFKKIDYIPIMIDQQEIKNEGFKGQKTVTLPEKIKSICKQTPIIQNIHITDIGHYPDAKYHYRNRPEGILQYILIHCLDGRGWIKTPLIQIELKKDEFTIIPAGTPHSYGADKATPWSINWFHFTGNETKHYQHLFEEKFAAAHKSKVNSTIPEKTFFSILKVFELGFNKDNLLFCSCTLSHLLSSYFFSHYNFESSSVLHSKQMSLSEKSIRFMKINLDQNITLTQFAERANLSTSQYAYVFKSETGHSPIDYFNQLKIQQACQYLQFTTLRVKEIALKIGIEDPYYFSRLFSKMMGVSPRNYRKSH